MSKRKIDLIKIVLFDETINTKLLQVFNDRKKQQEAQKIIEVTNNFITKAEANRQLKIRFFYFIKIK